MLLERFLKKENTRFKLKVGVFLVLIQNEKVLLSRRFNTGIADGLFVVPMGGLEEKETLKEAFIREMKEEIGIEIQESDAKVVHMMHRLHHMPSGYDFPQLDVFFKVDHFKGEITNLEPEKCSELKFYPLEDLPKTLEPFIKKALDHIEDGDFYSEYGWGNHLKEESDEALRLDPSIYQSTSKTYDKYRTADEDIVNSFIKHLECEKEKKYLEVGCGSGNYTCALNTLGFSCEGLDLSEEMLVKAHKRYPQLRWTLGDMRVLPFESKSYDGVFSINTLYYVQDSLNAVFKEMYRVLKPGGKFCLFAVDLEQCLGFYLGHYFPYFWDIAPYALVPKETLVSHLKDAGFSHIEVEPYFVTENSSDLFTYACKYRPHLFLDETIRSGMTPLNLPEYARETHLGCNKLQEDIKSGVIKKVISNYETNKGEALFISGEKPNNIN